MKKKIKQRQPWARKQHFMNVMSIRHPISTILKTKPFQKIIHVQEPRKAAGEDEDERYAVYGYPPINKNKNKK